LSTDHRQAHVGAASLRDGPTGPLAGVRIVDLTQALAGPFCTMLLADLGADVIKVEPPAGDMTRLVGPFPEDDQDHFFGGYFASVNRNKRSIVVDLKTEEGKHQLRRLVAGADALVENFRTGVMDGLGVSYETLAAVNPRLVYVAVRGFGDPRTGVSPYVDWPAYDIVAQAMSGVVSSTGTEDGETVRVGPSIGDLYPATVAALGLVSALLHARETGVGQFVDVSMYDALFALCEAIAYRYSYAGVVTGPTGNSHPQLSPFDVYPTADGGCAIASPSAKHWELLCEIIGRPDLITDDRTATNGHRMKHAAYVRQVMSEWTAARTTSEVVAALAGRVPVGPVNDAVALFADPHLRARGMLVAIEHPGSGRPLVFPNSPIHCTVTPTGAWRRAPKLGEHTDEVLGELGDSSS
jgi:crotonobetainyl-CoA:carnitine CoA-transferase CaiB-like acyl-CoA transferase